MAIVPRSCHFFRAAAVMLFLAGGCLVFSGFFAVECLEENNFTGERAFRTLWRLFFFDCGLLFHYTLRFFTLSKTPKALNSHITNSITTTTLSMFFIFPSIGRYEFTSHNKTPTIITTSKMVKTGIIKDFKLFNAKFNPFNGLIVTQPCV
jgi:hypothetical protein